MLLRGVPRDHSHDDVVTFCESHILVGEVVVGLGVNVRFGSLADLHYIISLTSAFGGEADVQLPRNPAK